MDGNITTSYLDPSQSTPMNKIITTVVSPVYELSTTIALVSTLLIVLMVSGAGIAAHLIKK